MNSIEVINKIKTTVLSNAVVNEEGGRLIEQNIIDSVKELIKNTPALRTSVPKTAGLIVLHSSEDKIISGFIFGSAKLADGEFVQIKKHLELTSTNFDLSIVRTAKGSKYLVTK